MQKDSIYSPTALELFALPAISLLLLSLKNSSLFYQRFVSDTDREIAVGVVNANIGYINNETVNRSGVFLFWVLVGAITYSLLALTTYIVKVYRSDVPMLHHTIFISPKTAAHTNEIRILRLIIRTVAAAMILALTVINVVIILPFLNMLFGVGILGDAYLLVIAAVLGVAFDFFVFIFLARLFVLRRRVFSA